MLTDVDVLLFRRLLVAGPMIYLGLLMIVDPPRINRLLDGLVHAICRFENHFREALWQEPLDAAVSPVGPVAARVTGLIVTALGMVYIVVLIH